MPKKMGMGEANGVVETGQERACRERSGVERADVVRAGVGGADVGLADVNGADEERADVGFADVNGADEECADVDGTDLGRSGVGCAFGVTPPRIGKWARLAEGMRGSMAVEAALALPMFLFACILLLFPLRLMDTHRKVQMRVEQCLEHLSQYGYTYQQFQKGRNPALEKTAVLASVSAVVAGCMEEGHILLFSPLRSEILEDGETMQVVVDYWVKTPVAFFGFGSFPQTLTASRRIWVGAGPTATGDGAGDTDPIVYVGKNSTRYHTDSHCHYLYNDLQGVSVGDVENIRNKSGGKYTPCARCGANAIGTVYVMPYGQHYHSDTQCTAIIAYVRAVPLSQVEHLGGCSYCSRN
ncbi:MAG: hypothetical protein LBR77_00965 [Lachnospiraceae bacterium]|jgi:hypothetical protein|nr:hypothetical protein [Lachnospiraceae bacterium]